jgi:WD40 repeat protein/serine/threonine protein kinase
MPSDSPCPDVRELERLALGQIREHEAGLLEEHLEQCDRCFETIHALGAGDTLLEALRRARAAVIPESDRYLVEGLITRLRGLAATCREPSAQGIGTQAPTVEGPSGGVPAELYDFLAPPREPGELGRLGPYRILQVLGAGGMGVVFQAEDIQLKRLVALKAMKPALAASASARQRFLREAQAAAAIEHNHIVTIYHVSQDRDIPFLAMQLLRGESLHDRLKREAALPLAEVLHITRAVAEGLAAAHQRGLIHRDIKPANIWLENKDEGKRMKDEGRQAPGASSFILYPSSFCVKILDFGLARPTEAEEHLTQTGVVIGTPEFMAPEQARGEAVDARCDLFSLGCVCYQMSTGRVPFGKKGIIAEYLRDGPEGLPPPLEINPAIPPEFSDLVMQLLARDAKDRPPSARAVVEAIQAMESRSEQGSAAEVRLSDGPRQELPQPLPAPPLPSKGCTMPRRWGWLAAGAAVLLVLGAAGYQWGPAIIRIAGNKGELVIETDREVEILLKQNGEVVEARDTQTNRTFEIRAGEYEAEIVEKPEGVRLATRHFRLSRGGREVLNVRMEQAKAGPPPSDKQAEAPAERAGSLLDRLDPKAIPADERFPWQPPELVAVLGTHKGRHWRPVECVAVSPKGDLLASVGGDWADFAIRIWNAQTLQEVFTLQPRARVAYDHGSVAFSPDGKKLASAGGPVVQLWDMTNGQEILFFEAYPERLHSVAFSPDGNRLLAGGGSREDAPLLKDGKPLPPDWSLRLWDLTTGKELRRFEGHTRPVRSVAFSPDGQRALSAGEDQTMRLWDLETGKEVRRFEGHASTVWSVAFSPDGRNALSGSGNYDSQKGLIDCLVRLWDVETGKETGRFDPPAEVHSIAFAPDGRTALSGGGCVCLWDLGTKKEVSRFHPFGAYCKSVAFFPDGRSAVCATQERLQVWKIGEEASADGKANPELVLAQSVSFNPTGSHLAVGNRADVAAGHLWQFGGAQPKRLANWGPLQGYALAVPFAADGKELALVSSYEVRLWDLTGAVPRERAVLADVAGLGAALAPDGRLLATGGKNHDVVLWDLTWAVPKVQARWEGHAARVTALAFAPDGNSLASGSDDLTIRLWQLSEGGSKPRGSYACLTGHTGPVSALTFAPDGKTLLSGSIDGTLRLWDLTGAEPCERAVLWAHRRPAGVLSAAFAPDGQSFFSASADGRVIHWTSAVQPKEWHLPGPVHSLAVSPDGRYLATANGNGTVYILRLIGASAEDRRKAARR